MIQTRAFNKYWLPVLIWMMVIFSASGDGQSFQRSSRIIGPLIEWLFPNVSEDRRDQIVTLARKGAHLAEYAVLAVLFWRAINKPAWRKLSPWNWRAAGAAIAFAALYAVTDEYHQSTVPGRQGSSLDVLIDSVGATAGILFLWLIWKYQNRRRKLEA